VSAAGPSQDATCAPREAARRRELQARGDHPRSFSFPIRVYYEDTDAAGVVYYANYLRYMERARSEWLEALGFPLAAFEREHRVAFAVHRAEIDFLRPARLNDRISVSVEARDRGACRLVVAQRVARDGETLVGARIALACIDPLRFRPARIPAALARVLATAIPNTTDSA
jgi:acyl-CoA thioester hydrolase